MMELTDLEISKRIAEIEGEWFVSSREGTPYIMKQYAESKSPLPTLFSPLTDDGLCFRLMVKYGISFWDGGNGYYAAKKRDFEVQPIRCKNHN